MYLGIEIGGTKLQLGIGPGDGTLIGLWRGTVAPAAAAEGIRRQITTAVPELLARSGIARAEITAVGIGFGGPVDDSTQTILKSHQIAGWGGFPLAAWLTDLLGVPAVLGNDADVAGLAEALFGAGRGLSPIFYITIGSGIGGGLILDGGIYRGCGRGAAEIGHLRVAVQPDPSTGMVLAPLEEVASGWGIARLAQQRMANGEGRDSLLWQAVGGRPEAVTARHVAQAAQQGDAVLAGPVLHVALTGLAQAIRHVILLLCPRRIVIGGGVSLMGDPFFNALRERLAPLAFEPFAGLTDLVPAALGEAVVVHGALALARRRFETRPA